MTNLEKLEVLFEYENKRAQELIMKMGIENFEKRILLLRYTYNVSEEKAIEILWAERDFYDLIKDAMKKGKINE